MKEIKEFRKTWFSIIFNLVLFILLLSIPISLIGCIWGEVWLYIKICLTLIVSFAILYGVYKAIEHSYSSLRTQYLKDNV